MLKVAEICAGYGGLFRGLEMVLDCDLALVADNDAGASNVLAYRYPDVPNVGDLTKVDWAEVMHGKLPIDILTAGFP